MQNDTKHNQSYSSKVTLRKDSGGPHGKLIILSAPSGAGKSTLVRHLLLQDFDLEFSISATSRMPRGSESHGKEYYFMTADKFKEKIAKNEFIEYEEVYTDCFYGTLRSEVDRITSKGKNIVFDVDVVGGLNIKRQYGNKALALFIAPPNVNALEERLKRRATDSAEKIQERINKAEYEMTFAPLFDHIIINENLTEAKKEAEKVICQFLGQ